MSTDPHVTVRRAGVDDANQLGEVSVRAWQWAYRGQIAATYLDTLWPEARARGWRRSLAGRAEDGFVAWVAELDGNVVGFAGSGLARDDDLPAGTAELLMIYLLEAHVGEGLGQRLQAASDSYWTAKGFATASAWVLESNDLGRDFYRRTGWAPDGTARDIDIGGTPYQELRLTRRLG